MVPLHGGALLESETHCAPGPVGSVKQARLSCHQHGTGSSRASKNGLWAERPTSALDPALNSAVRAPGERRLPPGKTKRCPIRRPGVWDFTNRLNHGSSGGGEKMAAAGLPMAESTEGAPTAPPTACHPDGGQFPRAHDLSRRGGRDVGAPCWTGFELGAVAAPWHPVAHFSNVIAGSSAIPRELREVSRLSRFSWRQH